MEVDVTSYGSSPSDLPARQDVLQLLAQVERRLGRAVRAAMVGDQAQLLHHLTALAVLVYMVTRSTLSPHCGSHELTLRSP